MSKKVYNLVVAIVGGLSTIAIGFVTFFNPTFATAINASIGIGATAIVEICGWRLELASTFFMMLPCIRWDSCFLHL